MNRDQIKKITILAMMVAMSYILAFLGHLTPALYIGFLKYDPKDIIIAFSGFIFGPVASIIVSVVVSLLEMLTFSTTGIWGFLMNVLSSCAFACTACLIYRLGRKNAKMSVRVIFAALGLICGVIVMSGAMMLWNYLITPIYMGYPREAVASLLLPAFLPFNLIKGSLNALFAFLIYLPLSAALKAAKLIPESEHKIF